jgi:hypothetical protein
MISATMPSIRSVDLALLGLMFPAASVSTATFWAHQRSTGWPPWSSRSSSTRRSSSFDGADIDALSDAERVALRLWLPPA